MAVNSKARVLYVSTELPDGKSPTLPYEPQCLYQIDDAAPGLYFAIDSEHPCRLPKGDRGQLERQDGTADPWWWRWQPVRRIAEERRFGLYQTQLRSPSATTLRCYMWPSKLLDRLQILTILEDIERELDTEVTWDEPGIHQTRAYVVDAPDQPTPTDRLLSQIERELSAVRDMARNPYREIETPAARQHRGGMVDVPENRVPPMWGRKRVRDLTQLRDRHLRARDALPAASNNSRSRTQKQRAPRMSLEDQRAAHERRARRADSLRTQILVAIRPWRDLANSMEFQLTPAMQRDYRLRTLLYAFTPPVHERLTVEQARLSLLPPLRATDLFELWGAVRLATWIRELGWDAQPPQVIGPAIADGVGGIIRCIWDFQRGERRLRFEYGPQVHALDLTGLPPLHERGPRTAQSWAATRQRQDRLVAHIDMTPDYAITIRNSERPVLAIGDASLADPGYQKRRQESREGKIAKVARYRKTVSWWTQGDLVAHHPLGSFVVFPGPAERWADFEREAAERDCWLLCPTPGHKGDPARERFNGLLTTLA